MLTIRNNYSIFYKCRLTCYYILSKLLYHKVRLIRFPFDLRGREYINLGKNLTTGSYCRIEALYSQEMDNGEFKIIFGNNVQINDYVHISAIQQVVIGDNVLMASHVYISDNSHGYYNGGPYDSSPDIPPILRDYKVCPVQIGNNVWIGEGVIIMPGVTIGDGAIIGAHSLVNKNIPEKCIAVGTPAKVIKKYNLDTKCWERV